MKLPSKIVLLLLLINICLMSKAQCDLPYRSLSYFNKDIPTFMMYNFMDRAECYKGKKMREIYEDLQISATYITENRLNQDIVRLYIILSDESNNLSEPIYICWEKEDKIDLPTNEMKIYEKYKDLKIIKIGVVLSPNHKDYKKYNLQIKSRSSDEPRGYIKNGRMVYKWKNSR